MALTWRGAASPRQRIRKRSGIDSALSISRWGTGGLPTRADWATNESAITETRARSSRACSSETSISCRRRHPRLVGPVHEQAPDLLERHLADEVLDVDAPVAESAALLVRLGDLGVE